MFKAKIGRNDPCYCQSGKKYKKCCIDDDLEYFLSGQKEELTAIEVYVQSALSEQYPDHTVLCVSGKLTSEEHYRKFQMYHYDASVMMFACLNSANAAVLQKRLPPNSALDTLVMHHGAYRCVDGMNIARFDLRF